MGIFDSFEKFFHEHRIFDPNPKEKRKQRILQRLFADIEKEQLEKYSKHRDKDKSIFNPQNNERLVHYKAERFYLLERDLFACIYCGSKSGEVKLQPDHVIPYSKIPRTHMDNLAMACEDCNSGKSDMALKQATLLETLITVMERNNRHFPPKKYRNYRRNYTKLLK